MGHRAVGRGRDQTGRPGARTVPRVRRGQGESRLGSTPRSRNDRHAASSPGVPTPGRSTSPSSMPIARLHVVISAPNYPAMASVTHLELELAGVVPSHDGLQPEGPVDAQEQRPLPGSCFDSEAAKRAPAPGGGTRRPLRRSSTIGARMSRPAPARRRRRPPVQTPGWPRPSSPRPDVPRAHRLTRCTARVTDIGDRSAAVAPHLIGPLAEEGSAAVVDVEDAQSSPTLVHGKSGSRAVHQVQHAALSGGDRIDWSPIAGSGWRVA